MSITTERDAAGCPRVLYLSRRDVEAVGGAHSDLYVGALRAALVAHADGRTVQPLKPYLRAAGAGGHIADRIIAMPAHVGGDPGVSGLKWIGSKHDNPLVAGLERASAVIVLNDPRTNYPIGILEGGLISAWRTAAVSCLAAEHLARTQFADLALVGCGLIGRTHVSALLEQFDHIRAVHLYDARPETARQLAELLAREGGLTVRVAACAEEAVRAGEVVVACTLTDRPYIELAWLRPGALVCNVSIMDVHKEVFLGADKVVVDDWEQSNRERKVINQLVLDGSFSRERLHAELGEVVAGRRPGRERDDEIILLNPMGIAVEDIACAAEVYLRAKRQGVGTWLDLY